MKNTYIPLTHRTLLAISGEDARNFLQGLISNDVNKLSQESALYALMLTPQGKFLYDFFIYPHNDKIFLDCSALRIEEIKKKLTMYKLRSKVVIEDLSNEFEVVAVSPDWSGASFPDSRSPQLPNRTVVKKSDYSEFENVGLSMGKVSDYEEIRINLCIPSDEDMGFDKSFPLEFEMDKHNAIDYQKGCYVGQEVTARTHYRGTLRKKPFVVTADENTDLSMYYSQEITSGDSKIGAMCSASGNKAIALLRMEDVEKSGGNIEICGVKLSIYSHST